MKEIKKFFKVIVIFCIGSILLVGCGNKMYDKSIEQGKLAVANQEYVKAKSSFELALDEKEDEEARSMLSEVESFIAGLEATESRDLDEALEYFNKIIEGNHALSALVEEAEERIIELEEIKDQEIKYNENLKEAERLFEVADYEASKEILNDLVEKTTEEEYFEELHKESKDRLEKVNQAIEQVEKEKEAEVRRKEEEVKRKEKAAEVEKKEELSEVDRILDIAEEVFGTDALAYNEIYHNSELYYHFFTTDFPKVQGIIGLDGTLYDAYTYNSEGILVEL